MSSQRSSSSRGCCAACRARRNKVNPLPGIYPEHEIVEVLPKRCLRIRHLNPVPRDAAFKDEMQSFIDETWSGCLKDCENDQENVSPDIANNHDTKQNAIGLAVQQGTSISSHSGYTNVSVASRPVLSATSIEVGSRRYPASYTGGVSSTPAPLLEENKSLSTGAGLTMVNTTVTTAPEPSTLTKDDTALFFLHGVGGSSDVWQAQLDYFGGVKKYELIAPDFLGHGFSGCPRRASAYHFKEIEKDLLKVFDLYCKRKNIVIGHSYG